MNVDSVMAFLRQEVNEERSDALIDFAIDELKESGKLGWLKHFMGVVRRRLDKMLPEVPLDILEKFLRRNENKDE